MKQINWKKIGFTILIVIMLLIVIIIFGKVAHLYSNLEIDKQSTDITIPKIAGIYIPTNSTDSYAIAVFNLKDKNQLDLFNNLTIKFMELSKK